MSLASTIQLALSPKEAVYSIIRIFLAESDIGRETMKITAILDNLVVLWV